MTVLTRHSRRQKDAVRKRGTSLREKTKQIALKGSIRTLLVYEDPTHGVWHITKHCPAGLAFPDVNALLAQYDKTRRPPPVWPRQKYLPRQNVTSISVENSEDDAATGSESADTEDMGSVDCMDGATDVAATGFEERPESLDGHSDDDLASVDRLITRQLEETGFQAHRRLLRWVWGS
ncbi:hypothetical protein G3M48_010260 [Beauveria asiatica]|uniref:MADS-box domain-containing protein n=1 Tax=Beauveria asiatica TaxID=1069075 RepID=A0AAW0RHE8_9HYPO